MADIEADIRSTPEALRQTLARMAEQGEQLAAFLRRGPAVFLGCGSSFGLALAAAALLEEQLHASAQAIVASDYRPRAGWVHLAISRTGQTTELIEAMAQARGAGAPVALLGGERGSPAATQADLTLGLEFAPERGVIQTRFISAALLALRLAIGGAVAAREVAELPARVQIALDEFDPAPFSRFEHVVFLGRRARYGMARLAALNLQETALLPAEAHPTLDYRHGPIACAGPHTLVWCFDRQDDAASTAVLEDVRATGATVYRVEGDPQTDLARAQLVAVRQAARRGIDADAPRHLSRAVILPAMGA